ncbi:MAG: hypothetical protein GX631_04315 [Dehalococcoidales bacterium]|nr:hypothetical protein [Dehalococcoidales bacterium]
MMMKKITGLLIFCCIITGLLLPGCAKPQESGFDLNGETLLFKGDENGRGTLYAGSVKVYEGEFAGGVIEGEGKLYADGTLRYEGEFRNNQAVGFGTLFNASGKKMFEGVIHENNGTTYQATGSLFDESGQKTFYGDITVSGDTVTIGDFGLLYYPSGKLFYMGGFVNGEPDGTGTFYDEEGNTLVTGIVASRLLPGAAFIEYPVEQLHIEAVADVVGELVVFLVFLFPVVHGREGETMIST